MHCRWSKNEGIELQKMLASDQNKTPATDQLSADDDDSLDLSICGIHRLLQTWSAAVCKILNKNL